MPEHSDYPSALSWYSERYIRHQVDLTKVPNPQMHWTSIRRGEKLNMEVANQMVRAGNVSYYYPIIWMVKYDY